MIRCAEFCPEIDDHCFPVKSASELALEWLHEKGIGREDIIQINNYTDKDGWQLVAIWYNHEPLAGEKY